MTWFVNLGLGILTVFILAISIFWLIIPFILLGIVLELKRKRKK